MVLKDFGSITEFWAAVSHVLLFNEAANNLIVSLCLDGAEAPQSEGSFMKVVYDGENMLLSALYMPPYYLLLAESTAYKGNHECMELMAQSIYDGGYLIEGVQCKQDIALQFCKAYCALSGKTYQPKHNMIVYSLNKVNNITVSQGELRYADEVDMAYLPYWVSSFRQECGINSGSINEVYGEVLADVAADNVFIWEADDVPLCMATVSRRTQNASIISRVYTPSYWRHKGYATSCCHRLSKQLLENGDMFTLIFADTDNATSNSIYKKIGYEEVCDNVAVDII